MLKNYFKITWRNLARNKAFSIINISGLAVGMASAVLIVLWIQNEVSYDQFHANKARIYEAWNRSLFDNKLSCWNNTPKVLAKTIQRDYPEIEVTARVNWTNNSLLSIGDKSLTAAGNTVDSGFLQIFSFPMLKGDPKTALNDAHSIVITQRLAEKLFGKEEAMGKIIRAENKDNFTVTGILKNLPNNTQFDFEYLISWAFLRQAGGDDEFWGNNSTRTYVMLRPNATLASIEPKIKNVRAKYDKDDAKGEIFLYPVSRWRLYSSFTNGVEDGGGQITLIKLFAIIAGFILLIACINFMNLSTARSEKRAREVGIRKVIGAQRVSLVLQFIGESILIAFLSGIIAIIIVQVSLPAFNQLTNKKLLIDYGSIYFWLAGAGFILFTGILAGSYPAFFLSSFRPVQVLKGTFRKVNTLITPRKMLVVSQFTFAIILIICTVIIRQQINHAQERQTGYNKDQLIYHFLVSDLEKNYVPVKNELLASHIATSVTKTSAPLTEGWSNSWGIYWSGKHPADRTIIDRYCADDGLAATAGLQMVKGRDLNLKEFPADSTAILLNESAVKVMGFKEPLGQIVKDNGTDWHVIGVFKDFILQSPYRPTNPMVVEGAKAWFNVMHIRFNGNNPISANLKATEKIFKKYNPSYPFEYKFIDDEYARKFNDERRIATLAGLFAGLTIFISCLGLFGLATYMAENRIKEIGVRKVLGASVAGITALLSKDFLKLVLIALLIASPVAWWLMYEWLKEYPYRIHIQWWVFAAAGLTAILISLLTISYQAIRAAMANPVRSLRAE